MQRQYVCVVPPTPGKTGEALCQVVGPGDPVSTGGGTVGGGQGLHRAGACGLELGSAPVGGPRPRFSAPLTGHSTLLPW